MQLPADLLYLYDYQRQSVAHFPARREISVRQKLRGTLQCSHNFLNRKQNREGKSMSQNNNQSMNEITPTELKQRLDVGDDVQIIDVREQSEYDTARLPNSKLIPLGQIVNRVEEIDSTRETVVHCKGGGRSARAIEALQRAGFTGKLTNLKGGIGAWSNEVDPSVPKY